jgi:CheY-like chemotaxis protein
MSKKIRILLVEDNEDERFFMQEGFAASGLFDVMGVAANGDELLSILKRPGADRPEMVLSDLNMPGKNGYEILSEVRGNDSLRQIPIAILSSAPSVPFAERCKKLGACAYFTKPDTFLEYALFAEKMYGAIRNQCLRD